MIRLGLISIQGDLEEHDRAMARAADQLGIELELIWIKRAGLIQSCNGLIIPGGESTLIGKYIQKLGLAQEIIQAARAGIPIMGTCAGMILMASQLENAKPGQFILELMDIKVRRNAFGRQRESFEAPLQIPILGEQPFNGIFIRAPAIVAHGAQVEPLARSGDYVVAAQQGKLLALSFHPELGDDPRFHHYFLRLCSQPRGSQEQL